MTSAKPDAIQLRRALLVLTATTAVSAVVAGLARVGLPILWGARVGAEHGSLFVLAVFGTVISLERAVALNHRLSLLAPALFASFGVAGLYGFPHAAWLAVAGASGLVLVNVAIVRRLSGASTWLMTLGAAALALGAVFYALATPMASIAPLWISFFVLTIAAERLDLARLHPTPRWAKFVLLAASVSLFVAALLHANGVTASARGVGAALCVIGVWQLNFDLGRHTVRSAGLPRFSAIGVFAGASWLVIAGVAMVLRGIPAAGPDYDAALHGVFVGYVLSMVFAHAPVILPAVARVRIPFNRAYYLPLAVLHAGLALRIAGDLLSAFAVRQIGAVLNVFALVAFVFAVLYARFVSRA